MQIKLDDENMYDVIDKAKLMRIDSITRVVNLILSQALDKGYPIYKGNELGNVLSF